MTAPRAARPSTPPTRPATSPPRSDWRCAAAPGEDANAAGCRSAPGRPNGGRPGRPTTPAPPRSPAPRAGCGCTCAPGSPTDRSTRSPRPTCAAGKPTSTATSGQPPWPNAGRWRCASSSSPWTRERSTPTRSARCHRPSAGSTPSRSSVRSSGGPSPPRRPGGCWPVSRCSGGTTCSTLLGTGLRFGELAGLRRRRVHLDRAHARARGRPHPLSGRPVRQRLQAPAQERRRHPPGAPGPAGGRGDPPPAPPRQ